MANWIFTATNKQTVDGDLTGRQILERRTEDGFWGLGERTPNRKALKKGDRVLFYLGAPESAFAASATLKSDSFSLTDEQKEQLSHGQQFYRADYGVFLEQPVICRITKPISELGSTLEFTGRRADWWVFLQGGIRGISEADYKNIVAQAAITVETQPIVPLQAELTASDQLFALEKHLEDFIEENWTIISWGRNLALYNESDAGTGRQFPAGNWNIDFLAKDEDSQALVVIELKRRLSSDDAIGQVLRYIGWVRENVAQAGQKVEGLIICAEVDDALKYAVRELENVSVMIYKVSFSLTKAEL